MSKSFANLLPPLDFVYQGAKYISHRVRGKCILYFTSMNIYAQYIIQWLSYLATGFQNVCSLWQFWWRNIQYLTVVANHRNIHLFFIYFYLWGHFTSSQNFYEDIFIFLDYRSPWILLVKVTQLVHFLDIFIFYC